MYGKSGKTFSPRRAAGACLACFALVAAFAVAGCGGGSGDPGSSASAGGLPEANDAMQGESSSAGQGAAVPEEADGAEPDEALLIALMDEDEARKLLQGAQTNASLHWIASHPEAIDFEGETVQWKLLCLAADEPDAVEYVRGFADRFPADDADMTLSAVSDEGPVDGRKAPRLYQWDERWGYTVYCSTGFGLTGCGPTAFAMAYQGVSGNYGFTPYDAGLLAQELGYMAQYEGTSPGFFFGASDQLGISCESISVDEASLLAALSAGSIVITNVAHGYFSHFDGHYLVITGVDGNGKLVVNDPYSAEHSKQAWDVDFILGETKGLYAFH